MMVYADILVLVNFVVDYFLLLLTGVFLHKKTKLWRHLLAAVTGGAFSLYIFLPQSHFLIQTAVQLFMCAILTLVAFGFEGVKNFLRNTLTLFCVNFAYSGAMIAIWSLFKPYGMAINNSIIYFDISPIFLIAFSVLGYFIVVILKRLLKRNFLQDFYCEVIIECGDRTLKLEGIADSGNSLKDVFGMSEIFITQKDVVDAILGQEKQNPVRFRSIPCVTISGQKLLEGYRIDLATVLFNRKTYKFKNPILAISETALDDCKIIINPENLN